MNDDDRSVQCVQTVIEFTCILAIRHSGWGVALRLFFCTKLPVLHSLDMLLLDLLSFRWLTKVANFFFTGPSMVHFSRASLADVDDLLTRLGKPIWLAWLGWHFCC